MGVPTIGCHCAVCTSNDPRDNRLRTSVLLSRNGQNVLIDTTPDFRTQALRVGINQIEAVLLTHGHADHFFGAGPVLEAFPDAAARGSAQGRRDDRETRVTPRDSRRHQVSAARRHLS